MISDEKQYEFITKRVGELSNATEDGLKLFVPMYSAILGGSIWLRLQATKPVPSSYQVLSDALIILLTALCIFMVIYNLCAWWGYRRELAKLTKKTKFPAPLPHWSSAIIEAGLCAAMLLACGMFIAFNPFGFPN